MGSFFGILGRDRPAPSKEASEISVDLELDRIVAAATHGRERYDLAPLFAAPLPDLATIAYRQGVCADLEASEVRAPVEGFATGMLDVHARWERGERSAYTFQRLARYRDALERYVGTVETLARELPRAPIRSDGLRELAAYLAAGVGDPSFRAMAAEVRAVGERLASLEYQVLVHGSRLTVGPYAGEADYSAQVERTFERFRQAGSKRYEFPAHGSTDIDPVEEQIFDQVVAIFPEPFTRLRTIGDTGTTAFDPVVLRFERQVEFFLAYLDLIRPLREHGLPFVYPTLAPAGGPLDARETFDLALATDLARIGGRVVPNDMALGGPERVLVVTGPNQGGKTTFARAFGQLHYLARLGLPVPGREAQIPLCDRVFTMFEKSERPEDLRGKLAQELEQVRGILGAATEHSVLVLNESFSSTSVQDALLLGRRVLGEVVARGAHAVYVTFVDELAAPEPGIVSAVAGVSPTDPSVRTFRVVRAPANGRAYAVAIAQKYGLTYPQLKGRLAG